MAQISIYTRCKCNIKWILNEKKFEVAELVMNENQGHRRQTVREKEIENRCGKGYWKIVCITNTYFSIPVFIIHLILRLLTASGIWVEVNSLNFSEMVQFECSCFHSAQKLSDQVFSLSCCDMLVVLLTKLSAMGLYKGSRTLDLVGFPTLSHFSSASTHLINHAAWNWELQRGGWLKYCS